MEKYVPQGESSIRSNGQEGPQEVLECHEEEGGKKVNKEEYKDCQ